MLAIVVFLLIVIVAILLFGGSAVMGFFGIILGLIVAFLLFAMTSSLFERMTGDDWIGVGALTLIAGLIGALVWRSTREGAPQLDTLTDGEAGMPLTISAKTTSLIEKFRSLNRDPYLLDEAERMYRANNALALQRLVSIAKEKSRQEAERPAPAPPGTVSRSNEKRNEDYIKAMNRFRSGKQN